MNGRANTESRECVQASKLEFNKKCRRVSIKNIPCGVLTQVMGQIARAGFDLGLLHK